MDMSHARRGLAAWLRARCHSRALAAIALLCAAGIAVACGENDPPNAVDSPPYWLLGGPGVSSFGPFAGYAWLGEVRSVAASWTVPQVLPNSHDGVAATWIGAQAAGARSAPFIQVGTNEGSEPVDDTRRSFYYAFFSDTRLSFHASFLFVVRAGDVVAAQLRMAGGLWHLTIVDRTNGDAAAFTTPDESDATFDQAEWLQEDVSSSIKPARLFPYPVLSPARFHELRVDSFVPSYARVLSSWMSENHADLAPGPLIDDGFTLAPTQPTAIGTHYLQIAVALDIAVRSFEADFVRWTPKTSTRQIVSQRAAAATATRAAIQELAATAWPAVAQHLCNRLVALNKAELADTVRAPTLTSNGLRRWITAWLRDVSAASKVANRLRRALNLPQLSPIPAQ